MLFARFLIALFLAVFALPAQAQQVGGPRFDERITIPNFWDPQQRFIKPNIKGLQRLRFLTTTDFPPFSFIDSDKRLVGFHVDLARAICEELDVLPVCQIQALPFEDLETALLGGRGDLVMAGLAVTAERRAKMAFSRPYFRLPARFIVRQDMASGPSLPQTLVNKPVAIVDGTAHAAFARASFGTMQLRLFETQNRALQALQRKEVEAVFGDGLSLARWLQTEQARLAQNDEAATLCCRLAGEPYLAPAYFGTGLTIAMAPGNFELENAINFALRSISDKGKFGELYLRYFPIGLF
ncbi:MAG: transporter substrate-binding domain-containing protein [Pseudomonadota bacterium]